MEKESIRNIVYTEIEAFVKSVRGRYDQLEPPKDIMITQHNLYLIGNTLIEKINEMLANKFLEK